MCILMSNYKISRDTRHRLEVMTQTTDGFVVAEEDLKLRGPGDMEGTQQSGIAFDLRIANVTKDVEVMQQAREIAGHILDADPQLTQLPNQMLLRQLQFLYRRQINWSLIS